MLSTDNFLKNYNRLFPVFYVSSICILGEKIKFSITEFSKGYLLWSSWLLHITCKIIKIVTTNSSDYLNKVLNNSGALL